MDLVRKIDWGRVLPNMFFLAILIFFTLVFIETGKSSEDYTPGHPLAIPTCFFCMVLLAVNESAPMVRP